MRARRACWARWSTSIWSAWMRRPHERGCGRSWRRRSVVSGHCRSRSSSLVAARRWRRMWAAAAVPDRAAAGVESALPPQPDFTGREQTLTGCRAARTGRGGCGHPGPAGGGWGGQDRPGGRVCLPVSVASSTPSGGSAPRNPPPWWATTPTWPSRCGCPRPGQADQQQAVVAVRRWLEDHDRWLLVLDNAEAPDTLTGLDGAAVRAGRPGPPGAPRAGAGHLPGCQLGASMPPWPSWRCSPPRRRSRSC